MATSSRAALLPAVSMTWQASVAQQPGLLDLEPGLGDLLLDDALVGQRSRRRRPAAARARPSAPAPVPRRRGRACSGGCGPGRAGPARPRTRRPPRRARSPTGHPDVVEARPRRGRAGRGGRTPAGRGRPRRPGCRAARGPSTAGGAAAASGSVLPMTMSTAQRGSIAPLVHHLRPLITYSSPSRSIAGGDVRGVAAGDLGLGHREGGTDLAVQQRLEPRPALLLGAEQVQQLHVAGVRRRAVDRLRGEVDAPAGRARRSARTRAASARTPAGRNRFHRPCGAAPPP